METVHIKTYKPQRSKTESLWEKIGLPSRGEKLHSAVREGVSYVVYERLADAGGLDIKRLSKVLLISGTTIHRRTKSGRFNTLESDKIVMFAEVLEAAVNLFEGDKEAARQWMNAPVKGLGGKAPMDMLGTNVEAEAVLDLIGRLEHGVIA
ncbi:MULTISPECIES: antitoxin Xre/MbcA/ParS toxin-binding domain-containing protein [Pseudomonas]|uniref:type II RES/Xre toxin-antitoxin system antitoxin n=1 Tax=Pseudomonas TaxID=286 RepID=UPI00123C4154|nr:MULTISPECIES: antitoxin Xre/MbcA/ParS toxin-binding domain-containing protein [Pseudomonas]QIB50076.1 DUF2384 domain-containing protein [Pseudomonas sp. OIL-1]